MRQPGVRALRRAAYVMARPHAAIVLLLASLYLGCSRPPTSTAPTSVPAVDPRTTVKRLAELHAQRRYNELMALVVPARGREVVRLLMALDEFATANRRLCTWLRENVGVGLSQTIDQSYVLDDLPTYVGDDLGIFSRNVELLDTARESEWATVSYTATERLPARQVHLRLAGGEWRLDPREELSEHLPAAFRDMAAALDQVRQHLARGGVSPADLQRDPEKLMDLVKTRLRRGVELLSKARGAGTQPAQ